MKRENIQHVQEETDCLNRTRTELTTNFTIVIVKEDAKKTSNQYFQGF